MSQDASQKTSCLLRLAYYQTQPNLNSSSTAMLNLERYDTSKMPANEIDILIWLFKTWNQIPQISEVFDAGSFKIYA